MAKQGNDGQSNDGQATRLTAEQQAEQDALIAEAVRKAKLEESIKFIEAQIMPMSLSMPGKLWLAVNAFYEQPRVSKIYASVPEMLMNIIAQGIGFDDAATMARAKGKKKMTAEARAERDAKLKAQRAEALELWRTQQTDAQKTADMNALRGHLALKDAAELGASIPGEVLA